MGNQLEGPTQSQSPAPPEVCLLEDQDQQPDNSLQIIRQALEDDDWLASITISTAIDAMDAGEKAQLASDQALLLQVGGALSSSDFLALLEGYEWGLFTELSLMKQAGALEGLSPVALMFLVSDAEAVDQFLVVNEPALYKAVAKAAPGLVTVMFGNLIASPFLGAALASNMSFAGDLLSADAESGMVTFASANVADQQLAGVLAVWGPVLTPYLALGPKGEALSEDMKAALRRFAEHGGLSLAKMAMGARFNVGVTGRFEDTNAKEVSEAEAQKDPTKATYIDWSVFQILQVWDQLALLPAADVSENTVLKTFMAISGGGGFWSNQSTVKLGQAARPAKMAHTVRHEVGHAVHTRREAAVNSWLFSDVGFVPMAKGESGVKELITALGGYPAQYTDAAGEKKDLGAGGQKAVLDMLVAHINSGAWQGKTPLPPTPPVSTLDRQWQAMPAGVQSCFQLSSPRWYNQYQSLPQGSNGFYFFNHWYNQAFRFSAKAKAIIAATGDNYSAMSHKELFANCYAEYFADPAGVADHSKWGGRLPADVKTFFSTYIVDQQPYTVEEKAAAFLGVPANGTVERESNT